MEAVINSKPPKSSLPPDVCSVHCTHLTYFFGKFPSATPKYQMHTIQNGNFKFYVNRLDACCGQ